MLADKAVELGYVETISHVTVAEVLKKTNFTPHLKRQWCLSNITPPFLWRIEAVLKLYAQPYDPKRPVVCFDKRPCFLIGDASAAADDPG